jgi:hypothetical protein
MDIQLFRARRADLRERIDLNLRQAEGLDLDRQLCIHVHKAAVASGDQAKIASNREVWMKLSAAQAENARALQALMSEDAAMVAELHREIADLLGCGS